MAEVDIVSDILKAGMEAFPASEFLQSLSHQYLVRGWLSKKQLQGLYDKAKKVHDLSPGKLATLEAQILKMPNRYKSEMPATSAMYQKDERIGKMIADILARYPQHKRVLYFRMKYEKDEPLTPVETGELEKFAKLLLKNG